MKRNITSVLIVAITCFTLASCSKDVITGSGMVISEERDIQGFTAVETSGSTEVFITQGSSFSVTVKAYSNLVPELRTAVENGTLKIYYPDASQVKNDNSEVYITMPSLNGLVTEGDANISATGNWNNTGDFDMKISGSGNITLGDVANISAFTANLSGSGNVYALNTISQDANITISGSSNVELTVEKTLNVNISGSGIVSYKGNATVESKIDGSGSVKKL